MFNLDNNLVAWLPPAASSVNASAATALGIEQFATAPAQAVETWRRCPEALRAADALFCLGTAVAMGVGAAEDWRLAWGMYLVRAVRLGHPGAAFNAALLGLRRATNSGQRAHFSRAPHETLALLICAKAWTKDNPAILARVAALEDYMLRTAAAHVIAEAEKLAAMFVKEALVYAPAA